MTNPWQFFSFGRRLNTEGTFEGTISKLGVPNIVVSHYYIGKVVVFLIGIEFLLHDRNAIFNLQGKQISVWYHLDLLGSTKTST